MSFPLLTGNKKLLTACASERKAMSKYHLIAIVLLQILHCNVSDTTLYANPPTFAGAYGQGSVVPCEPAYLNDNFTQGLTRMSPLVKYGLDTLHPFDYESVERLLTDELSMIRRNNNNRPERNEQLRQILFELAFFYDRLGRVREALQLTSDGLDTLKAEKDKILKAHGQMYHAKMLEMNGRNEEALALIDEAGKLMDEGLTSLGPKYRMRWERDMSEHSLRRAQVLLRLGREEQALKAYDKAFELSGYSNGRILLFRANVIAGNSQMAETRAAYEEVLAHLQRQKWSDAPAIAHCATCLAEMARLDGDDRTCEHYLRLVNQLTVYDNCAEFLAARIEVHGYQDGWFP